MVLGIYFLQVIHFIGIWLCFSRSFAFCGVSCNFSFISDFVLDISLFSMISLAKEFSILFIFSKNQFLLSLIFYIFSLYFCSDLCDFSLITLGFVFLFLDPLGISSDCLRLFHEVGLSCYKIFLRTAFAVTLVPRYF